MSEQQQTTQLREADNQIVIEGILLENKLEEKEVSKKDAITGELEIETSEGSTHTIRVFAYKLKQDGTESGLYKGLKTIMDEYKSVASVGRENADKVRINQGRLGVNEYYGQDGMLRSNPQLSTNFINRIQANELETYEPKAEFEVEIIVQGVKEETNKDGDETGRIIVNGLVPIYGGKIVPIKFVVADEGAASYVTDNYEKGLTAKVFGDIVNHVEVTKTEVEVGFGKPQTKVTRKTTRELVITGGTPPYDEDNVKAYSVELIKKAMTEREVYLEELKNKTKKNEEPKKEDKKGFDTKSSSKKPTINTDDLPF